VDDLRPQLVDGDEGESLRRCTRGDRRHANDRHGPSPGDGLGGAGGRPCQQRDARHNDDEAPQMGRDYRTHSLPSLFGFRHRTPTPSVDETDRSSLLYWSFSPDWSFSPAAGVSSEVEAALSGFAESSSFTSVPCI